MHSTACSESILEITIEDIRPPLFKLRSLDRTLLGGMSDSIRANGLLQPIIVTPIGGGELRLVLGSHRLEAAKQLGWKKIPAIVRNVTDEQSLVMSLAENLQRNMKMNVVAEAKGYEYLISKSWTVHEIAKKIGKSDSYICNRLRVLKRLHPEVLEQVEFPHGNSCLSISHAEQLSSIDDPLHQLELADLITRRKLTLHQLEQLTRRRKDTGIRSCLCRKCSNKACNMRKSGGLGLSEMETNKRLLTRLMNDAVNKRDFDLFDACCSSDYLWHIYVWHGEDCQITRTDLKGLNSLKKSVMETIEVTPDIKVELEEVITGSERVAAVYRKVVTNEDGAKSATPSVSIYRIENGKLAEEWQIDKVTEKMIGRPDLHF